MTWILGICTTVIAIGAIATWIMAAGERWRWGSVRVRGPELGDGPFRSAAIMVERPRRLPAIPAVASAISVGWGMLTLFLFVPLGMLLCAIALPAARYGVFGVLAGLGALASTMSGIAIGQRLIAVSKALVVRTHESAGRVRSVAKHVAVHHVLVMATVAAVRVASGTETELLVLTAIPCAIGMGLAALLAFAWLTLRRLDREDAAARAAI